MVVNLRLQCRDPVLITGSGDFSEEGNGNPLMGSAWGHPMDRGVWRAKTPWGHSQSDMTK